MSPKGSGDRPLGIVGLVGRLLRDPGLRRAPGGWRSTFLTGLRSHLPLQHLDVRGFGREDSPPQLPPVPERVCLEVPSSRPGETLMLEAVFKVGCGPDESSYRLLDAAAGICGLIMELERSASGRPSGPRVTPVVSAERADAVTLIGSSPCMERLRQRIERVARTDFTVLIEGESGAGKELVARALHERSPRRRGPFVAVNCAALVESLLEAELFGIEDRTATGVRGRRGKFEHAEGGTLFLDEVSDLSAPAQAKLLRAIQELAVERVGGQGVRTVDTRIVVATNRGLAELVDQGAFRADLYYRLNGVEIQVPPLRQRRADVLELTQHFLARHQSVRGLRLSAPVVEVFLSYGWPGNVRELERVLERAVALAVGELIELDDLPAALTGAYSEVLLPALAAGETLRLWGSRYARLMLERCGGNKRRTCQALGISYHTLQAYLRYRHPAAVPGVAGRVAEGTAGGAVPRPAGPMGPPGLDARPGPGALPSEQCREPAADPWGAPPSEGAAPDPLRDKR